MKWIMSSSKSTIKLTIGVSISAERKKFDSILIFFFIVLLYMFPAHLPKIFITLLSKIMPNIIAFN